MLRRYLVDKSVDPGWIIGIRNKYQALLESWAPLVIANMNILPSCTIGILMCPITASSSCSETQPNQARPSKTDSISLLLRNARLG